MFQPSLPPIAAPVRPLQAVFTAIWPPVILALLCWWAAGVHYLLFHALAELLSIVVALAAMVVASTSLRFARHHFVVFVSLAIGWCAGLDLIHTLVFKGMKLLPGDSANPATQLWIAARFIQAVALVLSPLLLVRRIHVGWVHAAFGFTALLVVTSVGTGHFPTAYVDGQGLTPFKIYTEYLIIAMLGLALVLFWRHRAVMSPLLFYGMAAATVAMMASELAFTQYVSVYASSNLLGHTLKIFAYWFVFLALVRSTVHEPFVRLQDEAQARERLAEERSLLLRDLGERMKELRCLYAVSELVEKPNLVLTELLAGTASLLPPAFSEPAHAQACVESDWGNFGAQWPESPPARSIKVPVTLVGSQVAIIRVWYPDIATCQNVQLLPEEHSLVQSVANRVAEAIVRMQAAERVQRLQYLYEMLSATNRAVVRSTSRDELLDALFQALMAHGTFSKVFVALTDDGAWPLHLWRHGGMEPEHESMLRQVLTSPASPLKVAMEQLSQGHLVWEHVPQGIMASQPSNTPSPLEAWLHTLHLKGITQRAVVPLMRQGRLMGVVGLYAKGLTQFDEEQLRLLREMAGDIEFALNQLAASERLQKTEQKAQLLELRFQEVFRASPVPMQIFALNERRTRDINDAHIRWLGYSLEDIPTEDDWFRLAYRDDGDRQELRADWHRKIELVRSSGQTARSPEMIVYSKDGVPHTAQATMTVVGDDAVLAWTDLTEILQREQQLRESEKRFRGMVEQTVSSMYVRRNGRFIYVNPRFCEMTGWSADELLGHEALNFTSQDPANLQKIKAAWNELHQGPHGSVSYQAPLRCKSGEMIEMALTAKRIRWDDGQPATIVIAQDITEQKRAQDKIDAYVTQLEAAMRGTLQAVSNMVEIRDPYTAGHERRVGLIASAIAKEMGWGEERCSQLELLGLVHDIGKIAVPSEILTKPTRLSKLEMEMMRGHAQAGYDILKDVPFPTPVAEIIRQHHERMDGSGYPQGLRGDAILPEARVLAVADVIESMASHRPYRPAVGLDAALDEVVENRGTLYAPEVVDAAVRLINNKGYALPT